MKNQNMKARMEALRNYMEVQVMVQAEWMKDDGEEVKKFDKVVHDKLLQIQKLHQETLDYLKSKKD